MVDYCAREGLGFIPWFPLAVGRLVEAGGPIGRAAKRHSATPGQIALAWLLRRVPGMLPIPGTSSVSHLKENIAAAGLILEDSELIAIDRGHDQTEHPLRVANLSTQSKQPTPKHLVVEVKPARRAGTAIRRYSCTDGRLLVTTGCASSSLKAGLPPHPGRVQGVTALSSALTNSGKERVGPDR